MTVRPNEEIQSRQRLRFNAQARQVIQPDGLTDFNLIRPRNLRRAKTGRGRKAAQTAFGMNEKRRCHQQACKTEEASQKDRASGSQQRLLTKWTLNKPVRQSRQTHADQNSQRRLHRTKITVPKLSKGKNGPVPQVQGVGDQSHETQRGQCQHSLNKVIVPICPPYHSSSAEHRKEGPPSGKTAGFCQKARTSSQAQQPSHGNGLSQSRSRAQIHRGQCKKTASQKLPCPCREQQVCGYRVIPAAVLTTNE